MKIAGSAETRHHLDGVATNLASSVRVRRDSSHRVAVTAISWPGARLKAPDKPVGSFLFATVPPGVGQVEVAGS